MAASKTSKQKTLTEIGREAAREAQRKALLSELRRREWNLTAAGEALGMGGPSNVLRAIRALGLDDEYEAARKAGKVSPGSRIERD